MAQGIFHGLTVIDCASFIAAPAAATVLSDFGADVIKIEPPGTGDPWRGAAKRPGNPQSSHDYSWMLEGRNKRSLALDLAKPEGQAVLRRLAARADVFITNFPPPVRARLGVRYEDLAQLNRRLIYASFSGYGETGAEANKPGFDSNAWWARSGLMDAVRPEANAPPARSVAGMGDHPSAMAFFGAIVTALYRRERTGEGAWVTSSLLANGVWSNGFLVQAKLCGASFTPRPPRHAAPNALINHYLCRDGRWIILSLLNEERQWPVFVRSIGREDLLAQAEFKTTADRHARSAALVAILDAVFATRDLAEWRRILDDSGLTFGVVATLEDIPHDRQMRDAEVLVPFENEEMLTISSPFAVVGAPKVPPHRPPAIGEHSADVLRQVGYDEAEIARLRAAGVVA